MKKYLVGVVILLMAGPVLANSLGLPNELANGDFETGSFAPWAATGHSEIKSPGDFGVPGNPNGGQKWGGAIGSWGGNWDGPVGMIRQVVDESLFPGWDPNLDQKEIDLEFDRLLFAHHIGDPWRNVGLMVWLDWMDDGSYPDPIEPGYHRDLVYEEWVDAAPGWPGDLGADAWQHKQIRLILPSQPRFLSVEVEWYHHFAEWSFVGIDNIDLEARCIPEPATLGLLALGGLPLIRRRRVR